MTSPRQLLVVVAWMTGTLLSFSVMAIAIRGLSGSLSVLEMLTVRAAVGILIVLAIMAVRPELRHAVKTQRFGLHLLRNSIHFGSQYLWAWSVLLLPLATVFALEFTMPAWTILLAPFFLGERMTPSRIGAVILGIAGVIVIVRPGMETFQPASLMVLAAALGYAIQIVATKKLTATDFDFHDRVLDERDPARAGRGRRRRHLSSARSDGTWRPPSLGSARPGCSRISA